MPRTGTPLSVREIEDRVCRIIGATPSSSVRSYLRLNTPSLFVKRGRGRYAVPLANDGRVQSKLAFTEESHWQTPVSFGKACLYHADCFQWLLQREDNSLQAVVTDPPYGLYEYSPEQQAKLRNGKGGVWRIPPSFDGCLRSPLPRFTTLTPEQLEDIVCSSSVGRVCFYPSWCLALMSWSLQIRSCHTSFRQHLRTRGWNAEVKSFV